MIEVVIQTVIGPLLLLVVGWLLNRKQERQIRAVADTAERVHEQVANTHETNLRHDIDNLAEKIDSIDGKVDRLHAGQARADVKLDRHLSWSSEETSRIWRAIKKK